MGSTAVEPEVTPEENEWLMERLRPFAVDTASRRKFVEDAIAAIDAAHERGEHLDVDQFGATGSGKSQPKEIANVSLQQILAKGGTSKSKAYKRWYVVLSLLASGENGSHEAAPRQEPEPTPEPERAEPETEAERVEGDILSRVSALEGQLKAQKDRADKFESNNRVLKDRVRQAEATATEAQDESRKLRRQVGNLKGQVTRAKAEAQSAFDALAREREEAAQAAEPQTEHEAMYESEGRTEAERPSGFRDELGANLIELLGTTEYGEAPPQWLLDRIDRLAGF